MKEWERREEEAARKTAALEKKEKALAERLGAMEPVADLVAVFPKEGQSGTVYRLLCPKCKGLIGVRKSWDPEPFAGEFSGGVRLEIISRCPTCGQAVIVHS